MEPIVGAAFEKTPVRTSTDPEILLFKNGKQWKREMHWKPLWTNFILKSWNFPRNILELEEPREL